MITVADLAWLTGCWGSVGGEDGSGEIWTTPAGGTLFGIGRTIRDSVTVAHEFMQIRETTEGTIEFIARPSGQAETTFPMVKLSATEVVFENPEHDFPQRVIYHLVTPEDLQARIEGEVGGELKVVEFPLKRIQCGSPGEARRNT